MSPDGCLSIKEKPIKRYESSRFHREAFCPAAVKAIEDVINASGNELEVVERGTRADLLEAVKNAEGLIVRSDIIDAEVMANARS